MGRDREKIRGKLTFHGVDPRGENQANGSTCLKIASNETRCRRAIIKLLFVYYEDTCALRDRNGA